MCRWGALGWRGLALDPARCGGCDDCRGYGSRDHATSGRCLWQYEGVVHAQRRPAGRESAVRSRAGWICDGRGRRDPHFGRTTTRPAPRCADSRRGAGVWQRERCPPYHGSLSRRRRSRAVYAQCVARCGDFGRRHRLYQCPRHLNPCWRRSGDRCD